MAEETLYNKLSNKMCMGKGDVRGSPWLRKQNAATKKDKQEERGTQLKMKRHTKRVALNDYNV